MSLNSPLSTHLTPLISLNSSHSTHLTPLISLNSSHSPHLAQLISFTFVPTSTFSFSDNCTFILLFSFSFSVLNLCLIKLLTCGVIRSYNFHLASHKSILLFFVSFAFPFFWELWLLLYFWDCADSFLFFPFGGHFPFCSSLLISRFSLSLVGVPHSPKIGLHSPKMGQHYVLLKG